MTDLRMDNGARPGATYGPDSAWSYVCGQCGACCRDKDFIVTPYDVARLADGLGMLPAQVLARYVDPSRPALRTRASDGTCVFFRAGEGCTVHAARPAVCRLYPLGRTVAVDGTVSFVEAEPAPETRGRYGLDGQVGHYLAEQGLEPYLEALRRIGRFLDAAFAAAGRAGVAVELDAAVRAFWTGEGGPVPFNVLGVDMLAGTGVFDDALERLDAHLVELAALCGLDLPPERQAALLDTPAGRAIVGRLVITAAVLGVSVGISPGFSDGLDFAEGPAEAAGEDAASA